MTTEAQPAVIPPTAEKNVEPVVLPAATAAIATTAATAPGPATSSAQPPPPHEPTSASHAGAPAVTPVASPSATVAPASAPAASAQPSGGPRPAEGATGDAGDAGEEEEEGEVFTLGLDRHGARLELGGGSLVVRLARLKAAASAGRIGETQYQAELKGLLRTVAEENKVAEVAGAAGRFGCDAGHALERTRTTSFSWRSLPPRTAAPARRPPAGGRARPSRRPGGQSLPPPSGPAGPEPRGSRRPMRARSL